MAHTPSRSKKVVDYLRLLGNQYASLSIVEEVQDAPYVGAADFEPLNASERNYVLQLGNQYAPLSIAREKTPDPQPVAVVSKARFGEECRRIFRQYIPAAENGRLRPHHREFIDRNKDEPAGLRAELLSLLAAYDISAVLSGLRLEFNRERNVLTEEKLKKLEIAALAAFREKS